MPLRLFAAILLLTLTPLTAAARDSSAPSGAAAPAKTAAAVSAAAAPEKGSPYASAEADGLIANCHAKTGTNRFNYHRCLLKVYEDLLAKVSALNDLLLGKIGSHHKLGRLSIMQWSNHVTKSYRYWEKFIIWDCEWGGHLGQGKPGSSSAMTECRIRRAITRRELMEHRIVEFDKVIK